MHIAYEDIYIFAMHMNIHINFVHVHRFIGDHVY